MPKFWVYDPISDKKKSTFFNSRKDYDDFIKNSRRKVKPKFCKSRNPTAWFITDDGKKSILSPTKKRISDFLKAQQIVFHCEASFEGLSYRIKNNSPRFDFYLPELNLILEYAGNSINVDKDQRLINKVKNDFCLLNGIYITHLINKRSDNLEEQILKAILEAIKKEVNMFVSECPFLPDN
jgi:hypothetical protein